MTTPNNESGALWLLDDEPVPEVPEPGRSKWTERELLDRLLRRHSKFSGNGPEWSYMEHVRDSAGFANRTIDALAIHLWPSRNHEIHAYEVKVSRSDFRRELANECAKAATWMAWVEYFWIVAPADVVPLDELPETWGLLVTRGDWLVKAKQAKRLQPKPPGYMPAPDLPRTVVAAMLRAQVRNAAKVEGIWQPLAEVVPNA